MRRLLIIPGLTAVLLSAACAADPQLTSSVATQTGAGPRTGTARPPGTGLVQGKFIREGGPLGPGGQQPAVLRLSGTVAFRGGPGGVVRIHVGRSGTFSLRLRAGTYAVTGRTPSIMEVSNGGEVNGRGQVIKGRGTETVCSMPLSVTVTPRHTSKITLVCAVP